MTGVQTCALPICPEDEIRAAEQSWVTAVKARDTVALEKIFTPELIYGHASGAVETRQKYLDRLKAGKQRYDTMTFESTKIVMYGQSAGRSDLDYPAPVAFLFNFQRTYE